MADTQLTTTNLTTSAATFLANRFTQAGWEIYWQMSDIVSGTATNGSVTIVAEFPAEPAMLVLPPKTRTSSEVLLPAFSIQISAEPIEIERAGLGEEIFLQQAQLFVDGYAVDLAQHMAFATMLRNWFKDGTVLPIYDFEDSPGNPSLLEDEVVIMENRSVIRLIDVDPNTPRQDRYYLSMEVDLVFYD